MNATLKQLVGFGHSRRADLNTQATQTARNITGQLVDAAGSYGRGIYGGHATYAQDFRSQGSYGRGIYAGRSSADINFNTPASYGRGIYAGRNTGELDFGAQGSFGSVT